MLRRLSAPPAQLAWLLLGASTSMWFAVAVDSELRDLALAPPFTQLSLPFWLGLALAAASFFVGSGGQRVVATIVLACYFIATLSFIYPYAVMHDSVANSFQFPRGMGEYELYSNSYSGLSSVISWLAHVVGFSPWDIARFFPVGMMLLYLLSIGLILVSWRGHVLSSPHSCGLFAFFFFAFGNVFYLRINTSPQSLGFLMFLIALGLLPLASRSIVMKVALLVAFAGMILSHPITPLLAVPGLVVVASLTSQWNSVQVRRALELVGTFLAGYVTWLMYRADWILTRAIDVVSMALKESKALPIVSSNSMSQVADYVFLNRVFLIALLATLVIGYLSLWRSRPWYFVTAWGIAFSPAFVVFLSYRDFFDRIMLFLLVPCAVIFAESGERLCKSLPKLKVPASAFVTSLLLLSAGTAYFWIGAVDRVTQDEVDAAHYLASLRRPLLVYSDGFNLPVSPDLTFVPADRGIIDLQDVERADAVVVSSQIEHAVTLTGRSPASTAQFVGFLEREYDNVYSSGGTRVYVKRELGRLEGRDGD